MKFYNEKNQLRADDYPLYFTLFFAKNHHRSTLTSLFAFHGELKKIPIITPPIPGLIRLRWWQDQLSKSPQDDLNLAWLDDFPHGREALESIIQGYALFLEAPITTMDEVKNFAENTDIPFLHLGHSFIHSDLLEEDEKIITQVGICLTASYLYLQRQGLNKRDPRVLISDADLMAMIHDHLPKRGTPSTQWLFPLVGFFKSLHKAYKNHKKPTLLSLQTHMMWAYLKTYLGPSP